jgi:hypothetical protein
MYTVLQQRALTQAVGFRHFENPLFPTVLARRCLLRHHARPRLPLASRWHVVVGFYRPRYFCHRQSQYCFHLGGFVVHVGVLGYCKEGYLALDCFVGGPGCHIVSVDNLV